MELDPNTKFDRFVAAGQQAITSLNERKFTYSCNALFFGYCVVVGLHNAQTGKLESLSGDQSDEWESLQVEYQQFVIGAYPHEWHRLQLELDKSEDSLFNCFFDRTYENPTIAHVKRIETVTMFVDHLRSMQAK